MRKHSFSWFSNFLVVLIPETSAKKTSVELRLISIFTSAHLHLHIYISAHLHIFTSTFAHLHLCSYSHLHIYISAHLHICTSTYLLIFTSSHLYIYIVTSSRQGREVQVRLRFGLVARNPLGRSCVSRVRSAGDIAFWIGRGQPSAEIVRVEGAKCR